MFGDIGPEKLILILVVLLVIFGPKRIPELGGSLGKGIRLFKRSLQGEEDAAADGTDGQAAAVQQPQAPTQLANAAGAPVASQQAAPAQQAAPVQQATPAQQAGPASQAAPAQPTSPGGPA